MIIFYKNIDKYHKYWMRIQKKKRKKNSKNYKTNNNTCIEIFFFF